MSGDKPPSDQPLEDPALEALARDLADQIWYFGQSGESELRFARRFISKHWLRESGSKNQK
jgi:hypothetical protein